MYTIIILLTCEIDEIAPRVRVQLLHAVYLGLYYGPVSPADVESLWRDDHVVETRRHLGNTVVEGVVRLAVHVDAVEVLRVRKTGLFSRLGVSIENSWTISTHIFSLKNLVVQSV